ncbi:MAG: hypothetical protein AAF624_15420 [Bacteroidota bacterium]
MRSFLFFAFLLGFTVDAAAQGFNFFNGRNHAELDWQVAETEHFEIAYPARLAGIEAHAAAIAEVTYDSLSVAFGGVTFDQRLRIYLSDEDEIANGIAFNVGRAGFTTIWVHVNDVATIWTGDVKWLRKVLSHELAHLFHYRAIQTNLGPLQSLQYVLASPIPSFWAEGVAQYFTEAWDAQRGDRWLRTAVFEDRLSYSDGTSAWNGRLRYAVGNSQTRYLAERYGDSTIVNLLGHRKPISLGPLPLPFFKVHDFYAAFQATTGESYASFNSDWRKHVNVYYNTMASQMERLDSLATDPLPLPGQYLYHIAASPDTSQIAGLTLSTIARPVRRLYVMTNPGDSLAIAENGRNVKVIAEGSVQAPFAWHPDGQHIAYARRHRGRHGALINDLYVVHTETERTVQLTDNRRAHSPTYAPDGNRLAFVGIGARGTANVFVLDLTTDTETPLTDFTGDVQLTRLTWSPDGARLAAARFDADGTRDLIVIDAGTGAVTSLADLAAEGVDNRGPVWSPDGQHLAFTSMRDDVPNVFVADVGTTANAPADLASAPSGGAGPAFESRPATRDPRPATRLTYLFNGADVDAWLPADSTHPAGRLLLRSTDTKQRDRAYLLPADRALTVEPAPTVVPPAYRAWTTHRPSTEVPYHIAPDASLIRERYAYNSFANLTHAFSIAFPYYNSSEDYGIFGTTSWLEPLGKHQLGLIAGVSIPDFAGETFALGTYINNTLAPSLVFRGYRLPGASQFYGDDVLVENLSGGDVAAIWPLDWLDRPYTALSAAVRLRLAYAEPFDAEDFADIGTVDVAGGSLPVPEKGTRADVRFGLAYKQQRPYRFNVIHPLDGLGVRARLTVGVPEVNTGGTFALPDLAAYSVLPDPLGVGRFYVYGRAQARFGGGFAQDVLGLARFDDLDLFVPIYGALTNDELERVRGYRRPALGDRVLFGTLEYRLPPSFDLQTTLLGFLGFGRTGFSLFTDAALVWTGADFDNTIRRTGVGAEAKNVLSIGGFELLHRFGLAAPWGEIDGDLTWGDLDVYYRIQASLAF